MNMRKWCLVIGLFLGIAGLQAQTGGYMVTAVDETVGVPVVDSVQQRLKASPGYSALGAYERDLLYTLNFARLFPKRFVNEVLTPYLKLHPEQVGKYSKSLIADLNGIGGLGYLLPQDKLNGLARAHAADLVKTNTFSHQSSNGRSTDDRMQTAGIDCWGESINMSTTCPASEVVISQLLDINVPDLGHRKTLLSAEHRWVGIAKVDKKDDYQVTVFDLGCF